jgi:hypothetical protein
VTKVTAKIGRSGDAIPGIGTPKGPISRRHVMKRNMAIADRVIRVLVAAVVAVLIFAGQLSTTAAVILGIVAGVFLLTSVVGFCPLYALLHISTKKKQAA